MDTSELFTNDSNDEGTSGPHIKVRETKMCLPVWDSRKFFLHSVVGRWSSLDQENGGFI